MEIVSRLIKAELKLGKRVVTSQATKSRMFRKQSQSTFEDD